MSGGSRGEEKGACLLLQCRSLRLQPAAALDHRHSTRLSVSLPPHLAVPTLVARFVRKCAGLAAVVWALLTFNLPLIPSVIVQCERGLCAAEQMQQLLCSRRA